MDWTGAVRVGDRRHAFYLIGRVASNSAGQLECLRIAPNAAALSLPAPAVAVAGEYDRIAGDLVVLASDHLLGHALTRAGLEGVLLESDAPVDVEWDFAAGSVQVVAAAPSRLAFAADGTRALVDGQAGRLSQSGDTCRVTLSEGRHEVTGLRPADGGLDAALAALLIDGRAARQAELSVTPAPTPAVPDLVPVARADVGAAVTRVEVLTGTDGPQRAVAAGTAIHVVTPSGTTLRRLEADAEILSLRWWAAHRLLLAGCKDGAVIAFDKLTGDLWIGSCAAEKALHGPKPEEDPPMAGQRHEWACWHASVAAG